jgi:putative membrane protein insertion efficiency factor
MRNKRTIKLIKLYQKNKRISGRCHFIPSCSNYAIGCYEKFNWFYASILTGLRILKCTPFTKRKVDPVPLTKKEKNDLKTLNLLKEKYDDCFIDIVINQTFKYPLMESSDYVILTLEYLFGYSNNTYSSNYNIEFIGKNFVRCNYPSIKITNIDNELLNSYLSILNQLSQNNFINYSDYSLDIKNITHSKTYTDNYDDTYNVVNIKELPITFFEKQIESYFSNHSIIGLENVDEKNLLYFKEKWNALVIDVKDFKKHPTSKMTIVTGDNLTNPKIAYHFNCIVKFYDQDEVFDINKYNIIIPKK